MEKTDPLNLIGCAPRPPHAFMKRCNTYPRVTSNACGISLTGTTLYAKLVVTAIDRAAKQLTVKYTVDPNCGFFSFAAGLPKD